MKALLQYFGCPILGFVNISYCRLEVKSGENVFARTFLHKKLPTLESGIVLSRLFVCECDVNELNEERRVERFAENHGTSRPPRNVGYGADSSSHESQCKVAFFNKCIAREDCIGSCSSMGAHRYRWFRNGCCQCIDQRCHDYGELQPLCKNCLAD